ncbi:MAG: DUF3160 domain-containing protein [bacterium]
MQISKVCLFVLLFILLAGNESYSQDWLEDLNAYRTFLNQHQNLSTDELLDLHSAGHFLGCVRSSNEPLFLDSVTIKYALTDHERKLIEKHGFVVTERLQKTSFGSQMLDVWQKDLPLYISVDAILHAFHMSYDAILKETEVNVIVPRTNELLTTMWQQIAILQTAYDSNPEMNTMLRDVDFYLTVPRKIFNSTAQCYYPENENLVHEFLSYIESEQMVEVPFLTKDVKRKMDFSQFKPRGHYTDENFPILAKYFKVMIWLGRMEIYLLAPQSIENVPTPADIQRQTIDAYLLKELIDRAAKNDLVAEIENTIAAFVGEQDNVTIDHLELLKNETGFSLTSDLLDETMLSKFQNTLETKSFAYQRILSQILMGDPFESNPIRPASAFMLFGQRFVVDSYVTGSVVYDKINFNGETILRMLPSTVDILFALGNNAAAQLLTEELDNYKYSTNLAALRYLVDGYEEDFWDLSIYNNWLNAIRELNPPEEKDREGLPEFMQTAAWWQQKINSQLASWTELRHDNLLYAKQSYTGGASCSYPCVLVEPMPEFFSSMSMLAELFDRKIISIPFEQDYVKQALSGFLLNFKNINDTLSTIAGKELTNEALSENEITFLKRTLYEEAMCGATYDGWYPTLHYQDYGSGESLLKKDYLVADYHTAPTDEFGNFVGWVAHAGTGPVDMAIVAANYYGRYIAFTGPVMSYDEYTTTNFLRLTDEEWKETYQAMSLRPDFVNLYLADKEGESRGVGTNLLTDIDDDYNGGLIPQTHLIAANYPNPFNAGTIINYTIPHGIEDYNTQLIIYDIQGQSIKKLVDKELTPGNYLTRWDATNEFNSPVASGIYFYVLKVGAERFTGKMNLMK